MSRDRKGNVWLTHARGMLLLGENLEIVDTLFENENVYDVLQDRHESYWICTTRGVLLVRDIHNRIYDRAEHEQLLDVGRMRQVDEQLYFYSPGSGIGRARMDSGVLELDLREKVRARYGNLHDFCFLPGGRGLLYSGGLLDAGLEKFLPLPTGIRGHAGFPWQYWARGSRLYVASNQGFLVYDLSPETVVLEHLVDSTAIVCTSILEDLSGNIWVGTNNGLIVGREKDGTFHLKARLADSKRITDLALLENGLVVVATRGSGLFFIRDGGLVGRVDVHHGLGSNMCNRLFVGPSGLWVCCDKGLSLLPQKYLDGGDVFGSKPLNFGILDGLPTKEVNDVVEYEGYAVIATDKGIVTMKVPAEKGKMLVPVVHVEDMKAGNRSVKPGESLTVEEDNLEFCFGVGAVPSTSNLMYRYRLEGRDLEWRTTRERSVKYLDLPPGEYTFRVAAFYVNQPGEEIEVGRWVYLPFKIHETKWFWGLVFCLLLLLVWVGFREYFRSRHRRFASNLHRLQAEVKALRSQMQPHFVFNALGSIQHLILTNDNAGAQKHLVGLAHLMRRILEATRQESIPISEEVKILETYLELEKLRFGDGFTFRVDLQTGVDWSQQSIPPMLLQPLVENAIWHGLQLQKNNPTLSIRFRKEEDGMVCEVEDNGIGREASAKLEKRKFGTSIALENISERIQMINAMRMQPIRMDIVDLWGEGRVALGTCVKLYLPLV